MADPIPASDLPLATPGASDTVVGVDESTGAARRFLATELGEAAVAASNAVVGTAAKKYKAIACVIRQDTPGSGWYFIDDTNHSPVGVTSVAADAGGTLTVTYNFTGTKVGTLNITPDEAYAATGLTVGGSVGATSATFTFYVPFEARISNLAVAWGNYIDPATDTGFSVDTSTASTDGKVVFVHPAASHADTAGPAILVEKYMQSVNNGNQEVVVVSHSKTGFTLEAREQIAGQIVTDGSGNVTVTHELVTAPTAVWDAVSNRLDITHAVSTSPYAYSVQMRTGNYVAVVAASSTSTLEVEFYDFAGAKYTGAAAPASIGLAFTRAGTAPGIWSSSNRILIRRGLVKVSAANIWGAGSNFWIQGIMEVA